MVNDAIVTERVKARWADEEVAMMAAEEVRLTQAGVTFVNEPLTAFMPGRTVEAVKGKRRQVAYKNLVQGLLAEATTAEEPEVVQVRSESPNGDIAGEHEPVNSIRSFLQDYVQNFPQTRRAIGSTLLRIAAMAIAGEDIDGRLEEWVRNSFPSSKKPRGPVLGNATPYRGSRKEQRRARYARVQETYKKCRRDAARMVLYDTDTKSIALPGNDLMLDYWGGSLAGQPGDDSTQGQVLPPNCPQLRRLWDPITEEDVIRGKVRQSSACGLDGVKATAWCKVSVKVRTLLFNVLLLNGHLPDSLRKSRTVFLAKKVDGSTNPSDFRPISISSVITRQFHRILAERFTCLYAHSTQQSAYQHYDGVGKSVAVLTAILDESWRERKQLHIACLDAAKAFNSVTFAAIKNTLAAVGCPGGFTAYVEELYRDVKTVMQFEGCERESTVGSGVLQGDPLSGPIFTTVFESAIQNLDRSVGFRTGGNCVNAIAYADDIVLVASTRRGLQTNLNLFNEGLRPVGLKLNAAKSFSLSMVPSGKDKKMKIETSQSFDAAGGVISPKGIDDVWRYLGLNFEGKNVEAFDGKLPAGLEAITSAPLKPQQRMELLRSNIVPGVLHRLVLGTATAKSLKAADVTIRDCVRRWLHLPHDTPMGFFYTPMKNGGLGLPCLQHIVPLHRFNRYTRISETMDGALTSIKMSRHVSSTLHRAKQALQHIGGPPDKATVNAFWRKRLAESVDGKELADVGKHPSETSWSGVRSAMTSGEDYIHHTAIRVNAIPSRDRTTRGRKGLASVPTICRGGCPDPETTYHCIQTCYRSKGMRLERHNRVVDLLENELIHRGYSVTKERRVNTIEGSRQPDLIAVKGDTATIIDAQVVSGQFVDEAHMNKIMKYRSIRGFDDGVKQEHNVINVQHVPCTITYRGIWAKRSVIGMSDLGVTNNILHRIVTSVLRGSWLCWRLFNRVTSVTR